MSRRYESDCVGCDLPCIGLSCRYYRVAVDSCDVCLEQMINEEWEEKSQAEKIMALDDDINECLDSFFEDLDLEQKAEYLDIGISDIDYDIED